MTNIHANKKTLQRIRLLYNEISNLTRFQEGLSLFRIRHLTAEITLYFT